MNIILLLGGILIVGLIVTLWHYRRMRLIALSRENSTICTYARSFDYRNVDTQIMREVYHHVQQWAGNYQGLPFPVEADDCFDKIYAMDADDLDDMYLAIAKKLGISTEEPEANAYWNQVTSVKNLVLFLHNQPKIKKPSAVL